MTRDEKEAARAAVKLGDVMVRDPFFRPRQFDLKDTSELAKVVRHLFPDKADDVAVLIANRASTPKNVIDAKADGFCAHCMETVWLSPSSGRSGLKLLTVCMECLEEGWARL